MKHSQYGFFWSEHMFNPVVEIFSRRIRESSWYGLANNDGDINPGEYVTVSIQLANWSFRTINKLQLEVFTDDPSINSGGKTPFSKENWRNVPPGVDQSVWYSHNFSVVIPPLYPVDHVIPFRFVITDGTNSWTDSLTVTVVGYSGESPFGSDPVVAISDYRVNDYDRDSIANGDGVANPGEFLQIMVRLMNWTFRTLDNLKVEVFTDDPFVNPDGRNPLIRRTHRRVPPGIIKQARSGWESFKIRISPETPDGHVIPFGLEITDGTDTWTDSLRITVTGSDVTPPFVPPDPLVEIFDYEIYDGRGQARLANGDGVPNPGESISIVMRLGNWTYQTFENLEVTVSTDDPFVNPDGTATIERKTYHDVPPGVFPDIKLNNTFNLTISSRCPDGYIIPFRLDITDGNNTWTDSFSMTVLGSDEIPPLVKEVKVNRRYVPVGETVTITTHIKEPGDLSSVTVRIIFSRCYRRGWGR